MGFPFSFWKAAGGAVYDPAVLSLEGWWRASYSGSPWTPTASAGGSGSNGNLTEATNPAATGAAVNGLTPADYDGTNDLLSSANNVSTFITTTAWSCWALVYVDGITYGSATSMWTGDTIVADAGQLWGLHLSTSGGNKVYAYQWDGAEKTAAATISTGAWALVQAKYDGTNIKVRVDGGAWTSTACGTLTSAANVLQTGWSPGVTDFYDGKILEIGTAKTALSDATFDNILSYVNSQYALSL